MKTNRKIITIIVVLLVITAGVVTVIKLSPEGFTNGIVAEGEKYVRTDLGDEFLLNYLTRNFPDYETNVKIIDVSNKNLLGYYLKNSSFTRPQFTVQYDSQKLRCYQVEGILIYNLDSRLFITRLAV